MLIQNEANKSRKEKSEKTSPNSIGSFCAASFAPMNSMMAVCLLPQSCFALFPALLFSASSLSSHLLYLALFLCCFCPASSLSCWFLAPFLSFPAISSPLLFPFPSLSPLCVSSSSLFFSSFRDGEGCNVK